MPRGKSSGGFALTGKSKPAQFSARVKGQNETGFRQKSEKQCTAAMQGGPMPSTNPGNRWIKPARADASKQFTKAPGKAVF